MVRRISSRFRPAVTNPVLAASDDDEQNNHNNNDEASDLGSDIMTVSDIHTITNENEVAMMYQQQQQQQQQSLNKQNLDLLTPSFPTNNNNNADAAGGFGGGNHRLYSPDDIRTIDNDNSSIISDLQHTVGTTGGGGGGGNDDIHTVTGTISGSVLHLTSPSDQPLGNGGSTVVLGLAPNDPAKKPSVTTDTSLQQSLDSSFWSRTKRTLGIIPKANTQTAAQYDEFYDEGRPLPLLHTSDTFDDTKMKSNNGINPMTPPPAVIVTSRNNNDTSAVNDYSQVQGGGDGGNTTFGGGDSISNAFIAPTTSIWKQRLCGLRADRLILLLMFVLLCAVGVIVGAIVVSQQQESNTRNSAASNAENDRPITEDEGSVTTLTRTPTTTRPTTTVLAPTTAPITNATTDRSCDSNITLLDDVKAIFPVTDDLSTNNNNAMQYNDCAWVSNQTVEQLEILCQPDTVAFVLCRLTCQNCNELSMNRKKPWPKRLCGEDSSDISFDAGPQQGRGNCLWLSMSPFDVDRLCQEGNDAYSLCRETCRNCGPNITTPITETIIPSDSPTTAPSILNVTTDTPSVFPTATPSTVLSQMPSVGNNTNTTVPTTASPSPASLAPTLTPVTLAPVTLEPVTVTVSPAVPIDSLVGTILSASPASSDRLSTSGSPQALALEWLRSALDTGTFGIEVSDARIVQLWTLSTIAYSLGVDELWLTSGGDDECLWEGMVCSADTRAVAGIDLSSRELTGTIPPELTLLSGLIGLNLSTNNITGKLPNNFGSTFQQLQDLRFDRNDITGTLPTTVGSMSALRIWYMERNPKMTGTVPSSVVQLSNLEQYILYYTDITGVIPQEICDLPNLEELQLDCTKTSFTGDSCWTRCLFLCGGDSGVPCNN